MKKINLVLVDDHKMFLDGITTVLSQQEDMEILLVANTAKEALLHFKIETPDILITDIAMPEMNGLEFVKIVNQTYPNIKILVVSMFHQILSFEGIDGYLLKETGQDELLKAIRQIVLEDKKYFYNHNEKKNAELDFKKNILTTREKEIIILIANELTTDEIANQLFLSKHTIETHKKNIFLKLQVNNIAGLVKKGMYLGYLE